MNQKSLWVFGLLGLFLVACESDYAITDIDDDARAATVETRSSGNHYYMNVEGLLRAPNATASEYIAFPRLDVQTLIDQPSWKKYQAQFSTPTGDAFDEEWTQVQNMTKVMDDLVNGELEVRNNVASHTYQGTSFSKQIPKELADALNTITPLTSAFSSAGNVLSVGANMQNMLSLGHQVTDLGTQIEVRADLPGLGADDQSTLQAVMYFDKGSQKPVRTTLMQGNTTLMQFTHQDQYGDARDISISKFLDDMEVLRTTFSN